MAKHFEKLIFGGLHEKHAVPRGIWVPTQHSLFSYLLATGDPEPISYGGVLLSSLLHATVYVFTQFAECTGCK
jgi:hypothetical protein